MLCSDLPYADVTFDGYEAPSVLAVPGAKDVTLEFNSLSKSHHMAGWRVGMAVGNAVAVKALLQVKSNIDSGIFLGGAGRRHRGAQLRRQLDGGAKRRVQAAPRPDPGDDLQHRHDRRDA